MIQEILLNMMDLTFRILFRVEEFTGEELQSICHNF